MTQTPELKAARELRLDAKAFRENTVYDSEGEPLRLIANADRMDAGAAAIEALEADNAALKAKNEALVEALEGFLSWAQQQCPCENEKPNPCPLCLASVENLEPCKAVEAKFPRRILETARAALAGAQ